MGGGAVGAAAIVGVRSTMAASSLGCGILSGSGMSSGGGAKRANSAWAIAIASLVISLAGVIAASRTGDGVDDVWVGGVMTCSLCIDGGGGDSTPSCSAELAGLVDAADLESASA